MIAPTLLSMLCCPTCGSGELTPVSGAPTDEAEESLRCRTCAATFPLHFGFPTLIPRESMTGSEWALWREHLDKFQERRQARLDEPKRAINRIATRSRPHPPFARFTGIEEGTILDVGCGPGTFRKHFDPDRVQYVGLDPITLPDVSDFAFVQGVGEHLPFKNGVFTDVVVLAALDHFRDVHRFLQETRRVLAADGRLHIMQSVHEVRGPISGIKVLAHVIKDALEERQAQSREIPKHLAEYSTRTLLQELGEVFEVTATERYAATWYSPTKIFLTFAPKPAGARASMARSA